ncbi:hypothetical protein BPT24_278 [Tenacibaculum phage pT24]|uniref:Uncharacterized protein n=1 Tax=Tenacibaculum phage pT24 TaxID=1880590 RepID=A0A1B4XX61_9CAUD|nr:hypothetical protein HYP10_gp250 [Tenacibaculum phage pT24]BAV39395.1 hypothetical protein BPT24_278 [Tenacibaculum phage pT24]
MNTEVTITAKDKARMKSVNYARLARRNKAMISKAREMGYKGISEVTNEEHKAILKEVFETIK